MISKYKKYEYHTVTIGTVVYDNLKEYYKQISSARGFKTTLKVFLDELVLAAVKSDILNKSRKSNNE